MKGFLLEWIPWIFNQTALALEFTHRVALAAYTEATVEKEWLILHSIPIPVSSIAFPDVEPSAIKWRVISNPTEFTDSSEYSANQDLSHISHLGLSIIAGNTTFDLTEWVNEVKWCGRVEPTPLELFTIWCCEKGKAQFHLIDTAQVELITEQGDVVRKNLV